MGFGLRDLQFLGLGLRLGLLGGMQGFVAAQKSGELGMAWGVGLAQKASKSLGNPKKSTSM